MSPNISISSTETDATTECRLQVTGFKEPVAPEELRKLFASFGEVIDVHVPESRTGLVRGFLHLTLCATPQQQKKVQSVLNGTSWKSGKISIRQATPRKDHLPLPDTASTESGTEESKSRLPLNFSADKKVLEIYSKMPLAPVSISSHRGPFRFVEKAVHDDDMTLVNIRNAERRSMWKYGRYGAPVCMMRKIPCPGGTRMTYDPTHYKLNLERVYASDKRISSENLSWNLEQAEGDDLFDDWEDSFEEDSESDASSLDDETPKRGKATTSSSLIHAEDCGNVAWDDVAQDNFLGLATPENSESEKEETEFNIKPQFEGEKGRKLFELQRRAKGDSRFRFTEDFAEENVETIENSQQEVDENDISKEKQLALKVLQSMFGQDSVQFKSESRKRNHIQLPVSENGASEALARTAALTGIVYFEPGAEIQEIPEEKNKAPMIPEEKVEVCSTVQKTQNLPELPNSVRKVETCADFKEIFPVGGPTNEAASFSLFGSTASSAVAETETDATPFFIKPENDSDLNSTARKSLNDDITRGAPKRRLLSSRFFVNVESVAAERETNSMAVESHQSTLQENNADEAGVEGVGVVKNNKEIAEKWRRMRRDIGKEAKKRHKNAVRHAKRAGADGKRR